MRQTARERKSAGSQKFDRDRNRREEERRKRKMVPNKLRENRRGRDRKEGEEEWRFEEIRERG